MKHLLEKLAFVDDPFSLVFGEAVYTLRNIVGRLCAVANLASSTKGFFSIYFGETLKLKPASWLYDVSGEFGCWLMVD